MSPRARRSDAWAVQEVLDRSVRSLAIRAAPLPERVAESALTLSRLSREDLSSPAQRRLLDRIRLGLMQLDLAAHAPEFLPRGTPPPPREETLERIASEIVELRDLVAAGHLGPRRSRGRDA